MTREVLTVTEDTLQLPSCTNIYEHDFETGCTSPPGPCIGKRWYQEQERNVTLREWPMGTCDNVFAGLMYRHPGEEPPDTIDNRFCIGDQQDFWTEPGKRTVELQSMSPVMLRHQADTVHGVIPPPNQELCEWATGGLILDDGGSPKGVMGWWPNRRAENVHLHPVIMNAKNFGDPRLHDFLKEGYLYWVGAYPTTLNAEAMFFAPPYVCSAEIG